VLQEFIEFVEEFKRFNKKKNQQEKKNKNKTTEMTKNKTLGADSRKKVKYDNNDTYPIVQDHEA